MVWRGDNVLRAPDRSTKQAVAEVQRLRVPRFHLQGPAVRTGSVFFSTPELKD